MGRRERKVAYLGSWDFAELEDEEKSIPSAGRKPSSESLRSRGHFLCSRSGQRAPGGQPGKSQASCRWGGRRGPLQASDGIISRDPDGWACGWAELSVAHFVVPAS